MRKTLVLLLLSFVLFTKLIAQEEGFQFKFFPSVHFGFFLSPEDVNTYIENDLSSYSASFGTTDLIMYFTLGAGVGFRFDQKFEFQPIVEYSTGPKMIAGDANKTYDFNKFSGGLMANYLFPLGNSTKHSIMVGAGIFYSMLKFEEFTGNAINPRVQAGFSLNNYKFNPQVLLAVDLAKTDADENENFELNYNSIRIGVNLNF